VIRGDARQLPALLPPGTAGRAALVVTSPPYGPSVHGQVRAEQRSGGGGVEKYDNRYSHDPANLAHHGLDEMLAGFTQILASCKMLLRPGGVVVVTARPWRHHGELVDLPAAVLAAGQAAGLVPAARCVALLAGLRGGKLIPGPRSSSSTTSARPAAAASPGTSSCTRMCSSSAPRGCIGVEAISGNARVDPAGHGARQRPSRGSKRHECPL